MKPVAFDDGLAAVRTHRILARLTRHVARVNIVQAGFGRDVAGALKRGRRGGRQVGQPVARVEAREMQRDIRAEAIGHPAGQTLDLLLAVVQCGDEQDDDLIPDARIGQPREGVENRLELSLADVGVERLGEGLQVNLDGRDGFAQVLERRFADEAVGDHHVADAPFARGARAVDHVFTENGRFAVGVGDGSRSARGGQIDDIRRRSIGWMHGVRVGLRDIPVLTERAVDVTADGGNGERFGTGEDVEERLLLDRIVVERDGAAINAGHVAAVAVGPNATVSAFPGRHAALARAE